MRTPNRRSTINRRPGNFLSSGCSLCAVLATPWKQGGREIRRGAPLALTAGRERLWIGIRLDHLAIEMPGGVAEQRDHHGEAKNGGDPATSSTATINPHAAIVIGFRATARSDVTIASPAPAGRSSINGNETTLIHNATTVRNSVRNSDLHCNCV